MDRQPAGRSGPPNERSERMQAWVERSCAEQGVSVKITDRQLLAKVADLLRERPAQRRQNGRSRDSSKRL